jgi:hypothetical protein
MSEVMRLQVFCLVFTLSAATSGCLDKQAPSVVDAGAAADAGDLGPDASVQDASMQDASDAAPPVDAETDASVDAGPPPPPTCPPEPVASICARLGADCASVTTIDVCGESRTVDCGACPAGTVCGAGAAPNVCATCAAENDAEFCSRLGKNCGAVTAPDNCGASRTATCGTCGGADTCSPSNVCACVAETDLAFCARLGANCGSVSRPDNCGYARTAACGTCTSPETCGGSGSPYYCGAPLVCEPPSTTPNTASIRVPGSAPFGQGACNASQVNDFFDACLASTASGVTCNSWLASNASCKACLVTNETAAAYGPIVVTPALVDSVQNPLGVSDLSLTLGAAACLERVSPGCGVAVFRYQECVRSSCGATPACATASAATVDACIASARSGVCAAAYATTFGSSGACTAALSTGGASLPGDACVPTAAEEATLATTGLRAFFSRLGFKFCGP